MEGNLSPLQRIGVFLINQYQKFLSPIIGNSCRFYPTCSQYTKEAIIIHGFFKGCILGAYRILRLLGYSHAQLWDEGLMTKGVENYKHKDEIMYWKTRYKSSIITQIDDQIDEYEEALNGE